jgi:hypothetical protein
MNRSKLCWQMPLVLIAAVAVVGCGGESYPLAPVSGRITLNDVALENARVGFEPVRQGEDLNAGPGSYGTTDAEGRYRLVSLDGQEGAVIGPHRVWVRTFRAEEGPNGSIVTKTPERLPARYHTPTELTFTVPPEGTEAADFSLQAP